MHVNIIDSARGVHRLYAVTLEHFTLFAMHVVSFILYEFFVSDAIKRNGF